MAKISFNGREYDSPEAMPAEVRQLYQMAIGMLADKDQDGMPDIFAGMAGAAQPVQVHTSQFIVDGKAYSSLDELPADARQRYEQALGQFDANRNGIPDLLEGSPFAAQPAPASTAAPAPAASSSPAYQEPRVTVIGETPPLSRTMLMIVVGLALILLAIGAFYFLMR
jgi:hypothetical protein